MRRDLRLKPEVSCIPNTRSQTLIIVQLKEALERYRARTGRPLTYQALADRTGIARATIESLATRPSYNTSLKTIAKLCEALDCTPDSLLELRKSATSARTVARRRRA